jgi:homocysteine S-methyltransferase
MTSARATVLLDGAMGTELSRRGFALRGPLYASAALLDAPELVEHIHLDHIRAGAQIITTNSFGLHVHSLARAGMAERAPVLIARAVELVERARRRATNEDRERAQGWAKVRCAGSLPPVRMAGPRELVLAEQRTLAQGLVEAGVDLLLLETHGSVTEVEHSLAALAELDLDVPIWLSVVAGASSGTRRPDGSRLLAGDGFEALLEQLAAPALARVAALLIHCTQIDAVPDALRSLARARASSRSYARELPLGLYPHLGRASWDGTWHDRFLEPEVFAAQLVAWRQAMPELDILGACCGSWPDDIAALRRLVHGDPDARERAFVRLAELVP